MLVNFTFYMKAYVDEFGLVFRDIQLESPWSCFDNVTVSLDVGSLRRGTMKASGTLASRKCLQRYSHLAVRAYEILCEEKALSVSDSSNSTGKR
jgi:hypothetical protein